MKIAFRSAVATLALIAATGAVAQTSTNEYASVGPINGSPTTYNATNPSEVAQAEAVLAQGNNATTALGTRFTATSSSSADSVAATETVATTFNLSGTVNRDCSFYAGNNSNSAQSISFGTIGVRTGNNENVNAAFEMTGAATAAVETLTAGCNTNNRVEIQKNDVRGLVNNDAGGYDTAQFTANIPYSVTAAWTGVALNAQTNGTAQSFTVATGSDAGQLQQGAWRSSMRINFDAPVISDRGLVAGNYAGTTTLTLRAL